MRIGVPREVKDAERRVGLTPSDARSLTSGGHAVYVEQDAGDAVGFGDDEHRAAGARVECASEIWACPLIVKVKEVQAFEYPLLAPMSRIAGRLAPLVGAMALTGQHGGAGVLLTGVDAAAARRAVVTGAGNVATEAARISARLGCATVVFSRGQARLDRLRAALAEGGAAGGAQAGRCGRRVQERGCRCRPSDRRRAGTRQALAQENGVTGDGGRDASRLGHRGRGDRPGRDCRDFADDQDLLATYVAERVVHYAAPNMPSLVARTATIALTQAALRFVLRLACGIEAAIADGPGLLAGPIVAGGQLVQYGPAADLGLQSGASIAYYRACSPKNV